MEVTASVQVYKLAQEEISKLTVAVKQVVCMAVIVGEDWNEVQRKLGELAELVKAKGWFIE